MPGNSANGGLRITGLLKALPGLGSDEFLDRWLGDHVERFSLEFPLLRRVTCSVVVQDRLGYQPYDGIQDMWFDSAEDAAQSLASAARLPASNNVRSFCVPIDLAWAPRTLLAPPSPPDPSMTKVIALMQARPHVKSTEAMEKVWLEEHLKGMTLRLKRMKGLTAGIAPPHRVGHQAFDAIEDIWWQSDEDFEADVASPEGVAAHHSSAKSMWSLDLIVKERVYDDLS